MKLPMAIREPCGTEPSSNLLGDFEMDCCRRRLLPEDDAAAADCDEVQLWDDHARA